MHFHSMDLCDVVIFLRCSQIKIIFYVNISLYNKMFCTKFWVWHNAENWFAFLLLLLLLLLIRFAVVVVVWYLINIYILPLKLKNAISILKTKKFKICKPHTHTHHKIRLVSFSPFNRIALLWIILSQQNKLALYIECSFYVVILLVANPKNCYPKHQNCLNIQHSLNIGHIISMYKMYIKKINKFIVSEIPN